MIVVVAYDISDNHNRARAAARLLHDGARIQRSVFECRIEVDALAEVVAHLGGLLNVNRDTVHVFVQCADCRTGTVRIGQAPPPLDVPYWVL